MLALYLLSSAIVLASGKRARFVDLDGEVLPAVCKVVDEVTLKEHPECGIGAAFAAFGSADTTTCGLPTSIPAEKLAATTCTDAQAVIDAAEVIGWVDAGPAGDDLTGDGSERAPHASVAHGLDVLRRRRAASAALAPGAAVLVLAGGVHFVEETIVLTAADSNLSIVAAPSAHAAQRPGASSPPPPAVRPASSAASARPRTLRRPRLPAPAYPLLG